MRTGTKSLLFGVHQFVWYPVTVWLAWVWLYRRLSTWRECICIVVHDWGYWGYWGCEAMDDEHGERHPELGAGIVAVFGREYDDLVLLHSRHLARTLGREPFVLCWADKLSIALEPWWLYLPRAWASGELREYRMLADQAGVVPATATHREWHRAIRDRLMLLGRERRADAVVYVNPERGG